MVGGMGRYSNDAHQKHPCGHFGSSNARVFLALLISSPPTLTLLFPKVDQNVQRAKRSVADN